MRISDWSSDVCSSDLKGRSFDHRQADQQVVHAAPVSRKVTGWNRRLELSGAPEGIRTPGLCLRSKYHGFYARVRCCLSLRGFLRLCKGLIEVTSTLA